MCPSYIKYKQQKRILFFCRLILHHPMKTRAKVLLNYIAIVDYFFTSYSSPLCINFLPANQIFLLWEIVKEIISVSVNTATQKPPPIVLHSVGIASEYWVIWKCCPRDQFLQSIVQTRELSINTLSWIQYRSSYIRALFSQAEMQEKDHRSHLNYVILSLLVFLFPQDLV